MNQSRGQTIATRCDNKAAADPEARVGLGLGRPRSDASEEAACRLDYPDAGEQGPTPVVMPQARADLNPRPSGDEAIRPKGIVVLGHLLKPLDRALGERRGSSRLTRPLLLPLRGAVNGAAPPRVDAGLEHRLEETNTPIAAEGELEPTMLPWPWLSARAACQGCRPRRPRGSVGAAPTYAEAAPADRRLPRRAEELPEFSTAGSNFTNSQGQPLLVFKEARDGKPPEDTLSRPAPPLTIANCEGWEKDCTSVGKHRVGSVHRPDPCPRE